MHLCFQYCTCTSGRFRVQGLGFRVLTSIQECFSVHLCGCLCKCEFQRGNDEDEFITSLLFLSVASRCISFKVCSDKKIW